MGDVSLGELVESEQVADEELEKGVKLAAHDIFSRIQSTFSEPAYVTLEEVRDATGFDGTRTADAMAISLYRSRGKCVWGFEIKVSRNDWLKELKQPEKAESILRYCHHWALVVPDKDIVKPGELPSTWGLYVAQKSRLKCLVPAPLLEPVPMDMKMFTAMIYAVKNKQSKADEAALAAAKNEGYKQGVQRVTPDHFEKYYRELHEKVEAFEKASGLSIQYGYRKPEKIGDAVRRLMDADSTLNEAIRQAKFGVRQAEETKKSLEKQVEVLQSVLDGKIISEDD